MVLLKSTLLLSKIPPTKPILCIVKQGQTGIIGTAISDPYLGFASPLESVKRICDVEDIVSTVKPGALAFGKSYDGIEIDPTVLNHPWKVSLQCVIDEQISIEEAMKSKETEWEMWEEIEEPSNGKASTEAAVALNGWLWKHCGGWRNTFG